MNNIRLLRKKSNIRQIELCKKLDITQSALSGWENEKFEPDISSLKKMSDIFGVSIDYLLGHSEYSNLPDEKGIFIPLLKDFHNTMNSEFSDEFLNYEIIKSSLAIQGEHFAFFVPDSSMEPRFYQGDVLIMRKQHTLSSGEIGLVQIQDQDVTIKKVLTHDHGIFLTPFNHNGSIEFFTHDEVDSLPVLILGKVVELRGRL